MLQRGNACAPQNCVTTAALCVCSEHCMYCRKRQHQFEARADAAQLCYRTAQAAAIALAASVADQIRHKQDAESELSHQLESERESSLETLR